MTVVDKTKVVEYQKVQFMELSRGDAFEDEGNLYIKTINTNQAGHITTYNSVDPRDGLLHFVEASKLVYLVNSELNYTKIRE